MARGGAKRNIAAKPATEPAASAPRRPEAPRKPERSFEDQLFFSRIRRRAKWVFVLLIVAFLGGFIFFGVGSGNSGIGDMLQGGWIFGGGDKGSSTPGIRKGEKLVAEKPGDPASYRTLATAYQAAGKPDKAIAPLEKYSALRPKDADALLELAALYGGKASRLTSDAQIKQTYPLLIGGGSFLPDSSTELGRALGQDQVVSAIQSIQSKRVSDLYSEVNAAYKGQVTIYQRLVALDPQDATLLVQLAQAQQQAGDTAGAIASYEKFLKIAPDDPSVGAVKQQLQTLRSSGSSPVASTAAAATG